MGRGNQGAFLGRKDVQYVALSDNRALEKVIQVSNDPVVIDRANRYKRGETWTRP